MISIFCVHVWYYSIYSLPKSFNAAVLKKLNESIYAFLVVKYYYRICHILLSSIYNHIADFREIIFIVCQNVPIPKIIYWGSSLFAGNIYYFYTTVPIHVNILRFFYTADGSFVTNSAKCASSPTTSNSVFSLSMFKTVTDALDTHGISFISSRV